MDKLVLEFLITVSLYFNKQETEFTLNNDLNKQV